jgi:hypothetical protein
MAARSGDQSALIGGAEAVSPAGLGGGLVTFASPAYGRPPKRGGLVRESPTKARSLASGRRQCDDFHGLSELDRARQKGVQGRSKMRDQTAKSLAARHLPIVKQDLRRNK